MKTKIPIIEILLVLFSLIFFTNKNMDIYIPFTLLGLGLSIYLVRILKVKSLECDEMDIGEEEKSHISSHQPMLKLSKSKKEELIEEITHEFGQCAQQVIFLPEDIKKKVNYALSDVEVEGIAKSIQNPRIYANIWETEQKLITYSFSDSQLAYLIEYGSDFCKKKCVEVYQEREISYSFFDVVVKHLSLSVYSLRKLSSSQISSLIRYLSVSELLGYRTQQKNADEQPIGSFESRKDTGEIVYYESVEGNIITLIETCVPNDTYIRRQAFDKIINAENIDKVIENAQTISLEEARRIAKRNISDEMDLLLDRDDAQNFVELFPLKKAIEVLLYEGKTEIRNEVKIKYPFAEKSLEEYSSAIEGIDEDVLLGGGVIGYDIICLIEEKLSIHPQKEEIRRLAFEKIQNSDLSLAIRRWKTISAEEITSILEGDCDDAIEALFSRADVEVSQHISLGLAVQIMLGLQFPDCRDNVKTKYSFIDGSFEDYAAIINDLTDDELCGYNSDEGDNPEYDFIDFIEEKLSEYLPKDELRKFAFDKMNSSEYLHYGIERWKKLTEGEIQTILENNNDEEIESLGNRLDMDDVTKHFTLKVAVKVILGFQLDDFQDVVEGNFDFSKGTLEEYKEVIDDLDSDELFANGDVEYDFISLVEDKLSDHLQKEEIRSYAFESMKNSSYLIQGIERWKTLTKEEVENIIENGDEDEFNALSERKDLGDISQYFTVEVAVRILLRLQLVDFEDVVRENFDFQNRSFDEYQSIITNLDDDELCGYNSDEGDNPEYDFIDFIEEKLSDHPQKEEIRTLAFEKMRGSDCLHYGIERWNTLTKKEIETILKEDDEENMEALSERSDLTDLSKYFTLKVAVRIWLGLQLPDSRESVDEGFNFSQGSKGEYQEIINDFEDDELCGYNSDKDNEVEHDFIEFIEEKLSTSPEKDELRKLAFEKMQDSSYLSAGIARWKSLTVEESDTIFSNDSDEDIEAIMEREDYKEILKSLSDDTFFDIYTGEFSFNFDYYSDQIESECKRRKRVSPKFKEKVKEYDKNNE
jgi:hypothetical protein